MAGQLALPQSTKFIYINQSNFNSLNTYHFTNDHINTLLVNTLAAGTYSVIIDANMPTYSYIIIKIVSNPNFAVINIYNSDAPLVIVDTVHGTNYTMYNKSLGSLTKFLNVNADATLTTATNIGAGAGVFGGYGIDPLTGQNTTLYFKGLVGTSGISLSADATNIYIGGGGAGSNVTATTLGGVPLYITTINHCLNFLGLQPGSYINLSQSANVVTINADISGVVVTNVIISNTTIGTGIPVDYYTTGNLLNLNTIYAGTDVNITSDPQSGICISSSAPRSTYLTFFPYLENGQIGHAAIDILSYSSQEIKAFPIIYDSVIKGVYLHMYNCKPITIPLGQTSDFQFGILGQGVAPIEANFVDVGSIPLFQLNSSDTGQYINRLIQNLSIPVIAGQRLALQTDTSTNFHLNGGTSRYIMTVYLDS